MKSTGAQSSDELQWLDLKMAHQDNSASNGHKREMPYSWYFILFFLEVLKKDIP